MKQNQFPLPIKIAWYTAIGYTAVSIPMELVRRWHQLLDPHYFITWFDEFIVAGLLMLAVYKTYRSVYEGQRFLVASWGFASGMMFSSFFTQLNNQQLPDPAPVSIATVLMVKGIFFSVCLACLVLSLLKIKDN